MQSFDSQPTKVRYGVMGYLCTLAFILYIDRICIGQAGTAMKAELGLSNFQWGLVGVAFQIAYAIFEPTTGHWGDRYGSRRVLIRIVLWWSLFTALTGCVWNFSVDLLPGIALNGFVLLLAIRFLFGAGEAGALPNAVRVISAWFPPGNRGPAQALISTCAQIGGAAAPTVAAYLIQSPYIGWRWSFVIFGSLGVVWAWFFARWFRDDPATHPGVNDAERSYILAGRGPMRSAPPQPVDAATDPFQPVETQDPATAITRQPPVHSPGDPAAHADDPRLKSIAMTADDHRIPWGLVARSANIWLLGTISFCTSFFSYMLFLWFPTYLKEGRGLDELTSGKMGSVPFLFGASGVLLGGFVGDWLTARTGSRRLALGSMGTIGLLVAGMLVTSSLYADEAIVAVLLCSTGYFFSYIQLAAWWAAMSDVGGRHLGALFGLCNMIGLFGGAVSQVFLGTYADYMKSLGHEGRAQWDPAFYLYGGILMFGGVLWLFLNPRRSVVPGDAVRQ
jgi:ACS family glucarate transporter-like MFS transporter